MNWEDRINNYGRETGFPKCLFVGPDGRVVGTWIMGNDYRVKSEIHGGYPAGYLRRVRALFPDKCRVLHLFSGKVDLATFPGDTVDINLDFKPTFIDDAQTLARVPLETYDLVLADLPPLQAGPHGSHPQTFSPTGARAITPHDPPFRFNSGFAFAGISPDRADLPSDDRSGM